MLVKSICPNQLSNKKMIYNLNQKTGPLLFAIMCCIWSCEGPSTNKTSDNSGSNEFGIAQDSTDDQSEIVEHLDKVLHELPPPSEIPQLLLNAGAEFNNDFTADLSKAGSYQGIDKAALNLGVYATDAGYYSSYDQIQEAMKYIEGCQDLADNLGIGSTFNLRFMERFERNVNNPDSLASLLNEAMEKAEIHLERENRTTVAALVLVGSYIEGLYITTQVIKNYPKDVSNEARNEVLEPLVLLIADLEPALLDLIGVLNSIERDEIIEEIIVEMGALRFYYQEIDDLKEMILEDPVHVVLDDGHLNDVTNEVERIRSGIVSD